jgi:outer membrane protein
MTSIHYILRDRIRRNRFIAFMMLIATFAMSGSALAQGTRTITFEEAVRIALNQNVSLQQVENTVELESRDVFQQRMNFLPDLSFFTSGSRGSGFTQDQAGNNIAFTNQSVSGTISTQVNLFRGFADVASLERARYERDASEYSYDRARQDVVFDVVNSFLLYVNAREQVGIRTEDLESQRQQLAQIEEFVNVGSRPISDLYQQQALTAQAELQVLNAEREAELNKTRVIQVLHLDPFGEYDFVAPDIEDVVFSPESYDLDGLLRGAFEQRADIDAQAERIRAADQGIRIAKSSYWPTINLNGAYRSNFSPDFEETFFNQLDLNRGNSVGFSISYPIFDRFTRGTTVQQAEVQHENAVLDLQNVRQQVALQVRQAYLDYLTNEKRLDVTATQERAAQQAVEAAEERYNVGAGTLLELTQARAQYVEAVSNRVQARYDFLFQGKLVDYYVGRLDPSQPLF